MDERRILEYIFESLPFDEKELLGFDDAQAYPWSDAYLVVNIDVFDESTDWLPGMTPRDAGWKSTVSAISDVLVKGGRPLGILLGLGFPRDLEAYREVIEGIGEACREYSVKVWGGDTGESAATYISVVAIGVARKLCPRSGAKPGDIVLCTGKVGLSSVAYKVLLEGREPPGNLREVLDKAYRPRLPSPAFWIEAVQHVNSAIDDSDGFALTLHQLADASHVRIILEDVPLSEALIECSEKWGVEALRLALYEGGEEYNFIFTVDPRYVETVYSIAHRYAVPIYRIGRVERGRGVYMEGVGEVEARGWTHFKAWAEQ